MHVCVACMVEWQTLQPSILSSAVTRQRDINTHCLAPWNSSSAVHDPMSSWSHRPTGVASELDNDMNLDNAYMYSSDPDHETEEEGRTAKQSDVGGFDKMIQVTVIH